MIEKLNNYQGKKILIQKEANLIMAITSNDWGQMSLKYAQNPKETTEIIKKRKMVLEFLKKIYPNDIGYPICLTPQHGADIYVVDEKSSGKGWLNYSSAIKADALIFIEKPKVVIPLGVLAADCAILLFSTNFLSGYGLVHISRVNYEFIIKNLLLFLRGLYLAKIYEKSNSNLLIPPLKIYGLVSPYGVYPFDTGGSSIIINMRVLIEREINKFIAAEKFVKIECYIKFSSQITGPLFPSHHIQTNNNLPPTRMLVLGFGY